MQSRTATSVQLAYDIYDPIPTDVFSKIYRVGESVWGLARIAGVTYIACQGTELETNGKPSLEGWEANFDAAPIEDPALGMLHSGFNANTAALTELVMRDVKPCETVIFTGHSKGGGEAPIGAARLKLAGYNNIRCILWAPPNPGEQQFANWLTENVPGEAYWNCPDNELLADPVPPEPPWGVPAYPRKKFDKPPGGLENLFGVFRHAVELYREFGLTQ